MKQFQIIETITIKTIRKNQGQKHNDNINVIYFEGCSSIGIFFNSSLVINCEL